MDNENMMYKCNETNKLHSAQMFPFCYIPHPLQYIVIILKNIYLFVCLFIGCAVSSFTHRLLSSCRNWGLLSSCSAQVSHVDGFSGVCGQVL